MNSLSVLMPSWRGPELLKVSIPAILRSFKGDSKLYVTLNDADDESIEICRANKVEFIALKDNWGTLGVDFFLPDLNCEAVGQINSDMIPSEGWDIEAVNMVKNGNCSFSTQLVEPYGTSNPLVYVDNLGNFSHELEQNFQNNIKSGKYNRDSVVGYNHPIVTSLVDYKKVGGYSNNFDLRFKPLCYALDDLFSYKLLAANNGNYQFYSSGKHFTYHCISATNNKIDKRYRDANNGMNHFSSDSGMDLWSFRNKIRAFSKI